MSRHPFLLSTAIASLFLLTPHATMSQSAANNTGTAGPQTDTYTLKVQSQLVVLDVVVTDKHGAHVQHLTKDDFEVLENKLPQPIRSVEHTMPPAPSTAPVVVQSTADLDRLEPNAPVSIIVLDEMNSEFRDEAFARYSLKRYLHAQGDALSQPTMLIAVDLDHLMVLRDYTTSRTELLSALEHHLTAYPWHLQNGGHKAERFNAAFASLMEIAEATSGHAGHKNMIWIGRGFPSIDMENLSADLADGIKDEIRTCTNLLRDARITLYTVDPAGLSAATPQLDAEGFEMDPFGGDVNFNDMAQATGGRTFRDRNDVDALIGESIRDGSDFYTISYVPSTATEDEKPFRSIHVFMKDKNLRAITRAGYYAPSPAAAIPPQDPPASAASPDTKIERRAIFDLTLAAAGTMIYDSLPFTLTRDPAMPDKFQLLLNSSKVAWKPADAGHLTANITLYVESFDRKGKLLQRTAKVLTLQRGEAQTLDGGIPLSTSISTAAPAARIRFILRLESNGKIGTNNFYLTDPATFADPATGLHEKGRK
jgi:VWFA-related protein